MPPLELLFAEVPVTWSQSLETYKTKDATVRCRHTLELEALSRLEKEDSEVKTNLDYTVRPSIKKEIALHSLEGPMRRQRETETYNQSEMQRKERWGSNRFCPDWG